MKPTVDEREQLAERQYREHEQAVAEARAEGYAAGNAGVSAGVCPDYPSNDQRRAWINGRLQALGERMSRSKVA